MSEDKLADEFRQAPGIDQFSALEPRVRIEHRRARREPPKTIGDAHAIVEAIAKRQVENDCWVRTWRYCKQVVYLFALAGAFLLYYLIGKINEALSLPGIGF